MNTPAFVIAAFMLIMPLQPVMADRPGSPLAASSSDDNAIDTRFGPFLLLDSRSMYGKGVFPEPFLVDDSDLEQNELRLDWIHQGGKGQNANLVRAEYEKGFGLLTLEIEIPYEYDTFATTNPSTARHGHDRIQGFGNLSVGARHPLYQFVSANEFFDTTFGAAIEVGLPVNSPISKNTEIVPKLFNDLRLGEHLTLQTVVGYSLLYGSRPDGGTDTLEYGLVLGYTLFHENLPLPDVEQLIPVFELRGQTFITSPDAGKDNLVGNLALRANLRAVGAAQPRLGLGYLFPIDKVRVTTSTGEFTQAWSSIFEDRTARSTPPDPHPLSPARRRFRRRRAKGASRSRVRPPWHDRQTWTGAAFRGVSLRIFRASGVPAPSLDPKKRGKDARLQKILKLGAERGLGSGAVV